MLPRVLTAAVTVFPVVLSVSPGVLGKLPVPAHLRGTPHSPPVPEGKRSHRMCALELDIVSKKSRHQNVELSTDMLYRRRLALRALASPHYAYYVECLTDSFFSVNNIGMMS